MDSKIGLTILLGEWKSIARIDLMILVGVKNHHKNQFKSSYGLFHQFQFFTYVGGS
jgi:hypothetical protein